MDAMTKKTAAIIKRERRDTPADYPGVMGEATSYYLDPPLESVGWNTDGPKSYRYVWVSQAAPLGEWATYIFPANEAGELTDWGELDGSRKGNIDPDDLMRELGYRVIGQPEA